MHLYVRQIWIQGLYLKESTALLTHVYAYMHVLMTHTWAHMQFLVRIIFSSEKT